MSTENKIVVVFVIVCSVLGLLAFAYAFLEGN